MKKLLLASLMLMSAPASAKDAIVIIENGTRTGFGRQGLIDFARDYETNPRDLTLEVFNHQFGFDINANGCGANCTGFTFTSSELGINQSFTGANTADLIAQFKDYLKGSGFLKKFMRLINAGPGAQISGGPTSSINNAVKMTFNDVMFKNIDTTEKRNSKVPAGADPQFSGGFAQFSADGFKGKALSVTPGFALDFGAARDKQLKFSFPVTQIEVEGLRTYRAGFGLQYLYPIKYDGGWTLTLGPGASYLVTASLDLPNFSGLMGLAMSSALQKDWEKHFATAAAYYGRFNNAGGIDTDIQANIYGWGLQYGYRLGQRWVAAGHLVGMHERVAGFPITTYHTVSTSLTYKIFNKFDLSFSVSKLTGLPRQRYLDFGMGTAWFF